MEKSKPHQQGVRFLLPIRRDVLEKCHIMCPFQQTASKVVSMITRISCNPVSIKNLDPKTDSLIQKKIPFELLRNLFHSLFPSHYQLLAFFFMRMNISVKLISHLVCVTFFFSVLVLFLWETVKFNRYRFYFEIHYFIM